MRNCDKGPDSLQMALEKTKNTYVSALINNLIMLLQGEKKRSLLMSPRW